MRWRGPPATGSGSCGRERGRARLLLRLLNPLAQLDRIAVRIADLGARVVGPLHRSPRRLDAARLELGERGIHVIDLEGEALPSLAQLGGTLRDRVRRLRKAHHFERRAAEIEIHEIERALRRRRNAQALAHAEAERARIELDYALGRRSEELDV